MSKMSKWAVAAVCVAAGASALVAQAPSRPGEMTQARVWVQNRGSSESVPVVVEHTTETTRVNLAGVEPSVTLRTRTVVQGWQYRAVVLPANDMAAAGLVKVGNDGWEAVAVLQSNPSGATILFKRPQ